MKGVRIKAVVLEHAKALSIEMKVRNGPVEHGKAFVIYDHSKPAEVAGQLRAAAEWLESLEPKKPAPTADLELAAKSSPCAAA